MEPSARLFLCARCRAQVLVCSRCDRGQRYCSGACSQTMRRQSVRAAGARYQASRRGRACHAARQRCYRARQKKVTHQGSMTPAQGDVLALNPALQKASAPDLPEAPQAAIRCHFCGRFCSQFVRRGFLQGRVPHDHPRKGTLYGHLP